MNYQLPTYVPPVDKESNDLFQKERNDCTVKALSRACDVPYKEAYKFLAANGRKKHKGVSMRLVMCDRKELFGHHVAEIDTARTLGDFYQPRMTIRRFLEKYPKGTYIATRRQHAFAIKDGVILDNNNAPKQWIIHAWKVFRKYTRRQNA